MNLIIKELKVMWLLPGLFFPLLQQSLSFIRQLLYSENRTNLEHSFHCQSPSPSLVLLPAHDDFFLASL